MSPAAPRTIERTIDLNADVGEQPERLSDGREAALIAQLSSAHIACGGHAGEADTMAGVVALCQAHGVAIGAHPSYPDRAGFGRRALSLSPSELFASLLTQVQALRDIVQAAGATLCHVKPHGALYHAAADDPQVTEVLIAVLRQIDPRLHFVGRAGSRGLILARGAGLSTLAEGFADRRYTAGGGLVDRRQPGALLLSADEVAAQALALCRGSGVRTDDGSSLPLSVDTLCLHSDTPDAEALAAGLRHHLQTAGLRICAPHRV